MAEIRKYDPAKGNAIVEALRSAMGDPIRPVTPGEPAPARKPAVTPASTTTSWVTFNVAQPSPDEEADDED